MNSSLIYIGDVNIKVSKKSYKYKNSGTPKLFEYFSRWLAGETIQNDILPDHIEIKTGSDFTEPVSIEHIRINKSYRTTSKGPATIITSTILKEELVSNYDPSNASVLQLCDANRNVLAQIGIESTVLEQIKTGRQALVEWTLCIRNRGDEINE